ncbi:hypothetical protein BJ878DRAFT_542609 [Calycina marina]|uniref:Uncharacterized protein n=1 Tax=Calycina marina TaxID=1763456 RepID=A0A9P7Z3B8_9HELO|nr:hypothetical protein BJ878DRAFT_542609 [Calycina marina]
MSLPTAASHIQRPGHGNLSTLTIDMSPHSSRAVSIQSTRSDITVAVDTHKWEEDHTSGGCCSRASTFDTREESPYIILVQALSANKDENGRFEPKDARCTLDTGNLQDNFVSRYFLANTLVYPDNLLLPLTQSEQNGGFSATGHKLVPTAAV